MTEHPFGEVDFKGEIKMKTVYLSLPESILEIIYEDLQLRVINNKKRELKCDEISEEDILDD